MLEATTSERLAKGPYVAARVGFKLATFWTQGTEPTTEPPHPSSMLPSAEQTFEHVLGCCQRYYCWVIY